MGLADGLLAAIRADVLRTVRVLRKAAAPQCAVPVVGAKVKKVADTVKEMKVGGVKA